LAYVKQNFYDYRELALDYLTSQEFQSRQYVRTIREKLDRMTLPAMFAPQP
jgi:hypothetical protein